MLRHGRRLARRVRTRQSASLQWVGTRSWRAMLRHGRRLARLVRTRRSASLQGGLVSCAPSFTLALSPMRYRHLTAKEISALEKQECAAKDWTLVRVADPFEPSRLEGVRFEGSARLSNVSRLENYDIGDEVHLDNIGTLAVEGRTAFGNRTKVEALNEGGGRTLTIFEGLSAQLAYLLVLYRHRPGLIERLERLIADEVKSKT